MPDAVSSVVPNRGRSLKLFLADGSASGVITAELGVSSVRAVVASRTSLADLMRRDEATKTGIYLLVGPDPARAGRDLVYVGESDEVRTRLKLHDADDAKDFFTRAVLIVLKDENLTKAHGRYLESRIIALIAAAGRAKLANIKYNEEFRRLPESEIADMARVLDEIEILLPVLGFDVLRPAGVEPAPPNAGPLPPSEAPMFVADIKKARGRAIERGGEFVVLQGSTANRQESPGIPDSVSNKRKTLIELGTLGPHTDPELYVFTQDTSFGSPSGASATIAGRSDNGKQTWRVEGLDVSYALWRARKLSESVAP